MKREPLLRLHRPPDGFPAGEGTPGAGHPGLTLIELALVVAILATAVGIGGPVYLDYRERARVVQAIVDIRTLEHDIYIYEGDGRGLPISLDDLGQGGHRDPWNRPYRYLSKDSPKWRSDCRRDRSDNPLNEDFDLYSLGKDGLTKEQLKYKDSQDDVVRASEGKYVGLASDY